MSDFRIAVVGMAGRFPNADSVHELWEALCAGKNLSSRFTSGELQKAGVAPAISSKPNYVPVRGALKDGDCFDAAFFGYSPHEAKLLDPQHRIFLECAWNALEDSGYVPDKIQVPVGVFAGASPSTYLSSLGLKLSDLNDGLLAQIGSQSDFLSTRASYKLGLTGPSMTVQTGCSTSLVAIHLACQSLLSRECEMALAGGASIRFPQQSGYLYDNGGVYSPDGLCRAFDENAGGVFSGNGVALVVLKRLEDAIRDQDPIHAVILATAVNNDGREKIGFTAPSEVGQAIGLSTALQLAGISAEDVGLVEAHGTGTLLGDPIEVAALKKAFRAQTDKKSYCALGSVKTNLGHLDAAAGVTGFIKACLTLKHKRIPATLNFKRPNPELNLETSPFYVNAEAIDWPEHQPKIALVNSFGIGGTNAHVVLQAHEESSPHETAGKTFLGFHFLPLSGKTSSAVTAMATTLSKQLENSSANVADICHTYQSARALFSNRSVILCSSREDLKTFLVQPSTEKNISGVAKGTRKICFQFPGGGAQYVPMAADLYKSNPTFRSEIDACAEIISSRLNLDIRQFLYGSPVDLSKPRPEWHGFGVAFCSLFATEYALAKSLMAVGIEPEGGMIGHSLGEYVAATLAGVFELKEALNLIVTRGELFAKCQPGAMLSVRSSEARLSQIKLPIGAAISARNAPDLITVSGPLAAIQETERLLTEAGIECRLVPLQVPAHCHLLDEILPAYEDAVRLARPKSPKRTMISNLSGTWLTESQAMSVNYWVQQLRQPVNFASGLETLTRNGPVALVEVGPGRVLTSLARANPSVMNQSAPIVTMRAENEAGNDDQFLATVVAKLWVSGVAIEWEKVAGIGRRVHAPVYQFDRIRHFLENQLKAPLKLESWFSTITWNHQPFASTESLRFKECLIAGYSKRLDWVKSTLHKMGVKAYPIQQGTGQETLLYFPQDRRNILENAKEILFLRDTVMDYERRTGSQLRQVLIFTSGLAAIGTGERLNAELAPFLSAAKVFPQEFSNLSVTLFDMETDEKVLATALAAPPIRESRIAAVRSDGLYVPEFKSLPLGAGLKTLRPIRENGCYLITGGVGTVGLHLAQHLASKYKARVALVSRRTDISSVQQKISKCEELGGRILIVNADVADESQMKRAIEKVESEFERIHGVIHAAGVTSGPSIQAVLQQTNSKDFEEQFAAKVSGTKVLDRLLAKHDFDFALLFSSNASILGGIGMLAYSAANTFLDLFVAEKWKDGDQRWISATWDGWRVAGEEGLRQRTSLDRFAMQPEESLDAFERIVKNSPVPTTIVSRVEIKERAALWLNDFEDRPENEIDVNSTAAPEASAISSAQAPRDEIEKKIAGIWEELLGVKNIGVEDIFFDLGGHSLFATRMLSRLREQLGVEFPLFRLFEKPTVSGMADIVKTLVGDSSAKPMKAVLIETGKTKTLSEIMSSLKKS